MPTSQVLLKIAVVVLHAGAVATWSRIFWTELDPWLRCQLGKRWGIRILWARTSKTLAWYIDGDAHGLTARVSIIALGVLIAGIFTPIVLTCSAMLLGIVPARLAPLMVISSVLISAVAARRAGLPTSSAPK